MVFALLLVFVIFLMRKVFPFSALVIKLTTKFFNLCSRFAATSACKMVNFNKIYFKYKLSNEWVASFKFVKFWSTSHMNVFLAVGGRKLGTSACGNQKIVDVK